MLPTAVSIGTSHRPVKSGLPSAVRGAGAERFGLPSAVRGMPGVGCCNHCAARGVTNGARTIAVRKIFIDPNISSQPLYTAERVILRAPDPRSIRYTCPMDL